MARYSVVQNKKNEILMFTAIKVTLVGLINLSYCVQAQALMAFYDKLYDLMIVHINVYIHYVDVA